MEHDKNGRVYEESLRRTARAKWDLSDSGAKTEYIAGVEIDVYVKTDDLTHLIMGTAKRTVDKIKDDNDKLLKAHKFLTARSENVVMWIITQNEPTSDQNKVVQGTSVRLQSYDQFQSSIFNATSYLDLRKNYPFGSATDPITRKFMLPDNEYLPSPIIDADSARNYTIAEIAEEVLNNKNIILTGDFGAGKSLSMRELFTHLRKQYLRKDSLRVPIVLNLRDHWGQSDFAEALQRHATRVAFERPSQLVRAWNAGTIILLLDGFDELASQSWNHRERRRLREASMGLVRDFVKHSRCGLVISGREQYFDSTQEMKHLLGFSDDVKLLKINEFTEIQLNKYLVRKGITASVPEWIPRKPLLLSYLATEKDLLIEISRDLRGDPAAAWEHMVRRICDREAAENEKSGVSAETVYRILGRLASITRERADGLGPIYESEITESFKEIVGADPEDPALVLLQRLPGLTNREGEQGTRSFVDGDMLNVLRAIEVVDFVTNPYADPKATKWQTGLSVLGVDYLVLALRKAGLTNDQVFTAIKEAVNKWGAHTLGADLLRAYLNLSESETVDFKNIKINEANFQELNLEENNCENLQIKDSIIDTLTIPSSQPNGLYIQDCVIKRIVGCSDPSGLPKWIINASVSSFDNSSTNTAILGLDYPNPLKVLLVILRKMFLQRGAGREEHSLPRGLPPHLRGYINPILAIMEQEGIIFKNQNNRVSVWHPKRSAQDRVVKILVQPKLSTDNIVVKSKDLR